MNLSDKLVELTRNVCLKTDDSGSGGLGGRYGYGSNYENDVFMLHRYCWCEREDCLWCNGEEPNFRFKPTGAEIAWYKYIGRDQQLTGKLPNDWLEQCLSSLWGDEGCYIEFNGQFSDPENTIIICFDALQKDKTIIKKFNSSFVDLGNVMSWDAETLFRELFDPSGIEYADKEFYNAQKLRKQYPQIDKKINELALQYNKQMIDWHQKRIDIINSYGNIT